MSFRSSISLNRCFRARWLMPGFSKVPWKWRNAESASLDNCWTFRIMLWNVIIPPWCTFSQSRSVHMQICRHGSHRCRTSPEAQSPERPDDTRHYVRGVAMTSFPAFALHVSYLFLRGLRVENLVHFKDTSLSFVQDTERGLIVGVHCHHQRLALLWLLVLLQHRFHSAQHTDVTWYRRSRLTTQVLLSVDSFTFISLHTFKFDQLLMVLPSQRNFSSVFLKKIFVGFRHLTDGCWNLPKTKYN